MASEAKSRDEGGQRSERTTCTRKTRMLYMEHEASVTEEVVKGETEKAEEAENPIAETMLSPGKASLKLRRRSQGSVSPMRCTVDGMAEIDVNKKEIVKESLETEDQVDELNHSFKKTAKVISNAIVASRPIIPPRELETHRKPPFRKTASTLGKAAVSLKGMSKSLHHSDELESFTDTLVYENLKPLFWAMKIAGIFFVRPKGAALFQMSSARCLKSVSLGQVYCLFILLIVTSNFVRSFWAFSPDDPFGYLLFFKLVWTILWFDSTSRCFFFNIMWYMKKNGLQALFINIEKICYSDGIIPYESTLKQTLRHLGIVMAVFGTTAFATFAYGFFGPGDISILFETVIAPVKKDAYLVVVYKCCLLVVIGLNIIISCLSIAFYISICYIIYKEFEYMCRTFGMKIRADGQFADDLEKFRIAHQQRCKLVEEADQILKYLLASTFMAHVPLLCLLMYNLLDVNQTFLYRMYGVYWMLMVLMQTLSFAVAATMVNTQAHAPLGNIYAIRAEGTTLDHQLVVSMFLNKLTGTSIGLTAWDMFVINKPAMLTVMGMVLTYFFLLVQFRNPLQGISIDRTCNCNFFNSSLLNKTAEELIESISG